MNLVSIGEMAMGMKAMQKVAAIGLLLASLVLGAAPTVAAVPQLINYQGVLETSTGTPIAGPVNLTFSIYAVASGPDVALWTETQNNVAVTNGLFNVLLGSVTPLPGDLFQSVDRWLGIKVGTDAEMTPRQKLVSVAYSVKAGDADTLGAGIVTTDKAAGTLDVLSTNGLFRLGSKNATSTLNAGRMVVRNYDSTKLPLYVFGGAPTPTANFLAFGGGADIGYAATQIDFFTAPNTTTPIGTSRISINGAGNVGIGTTTPTDKLQVAGSVRADAFLTPSSRALKKEIIPLRGDEYQAILEQINGLQMVRFRYTHEENREPHLGVIAEESPQQILDPTGKAVSLSDYASFLLAGLKAQSEKIEAQSAEISALKVQIQALEARLKGPYPQMGGAP